jgi:hypothetical protein
MASAQLIIGSLSSTMVYGTGDADVVSSEQTDEYTKEVQAVDGLGRVIAIALSAPIRSTRVEKYGTTTPEELGGANNNIRVSLRRSNEDFARVTVETKQILATT